MKMESLRVFHSALGLEQDQHWYSLVITMVVHIAALGTELDAFGAATMVALFGAKQLLFSFHSFS